MSLIDLKIELELQLDRKPKLLGFEGPCFEVGMTYFISFLKYLKIVLHFSSDL